MIKNQTPTPDIYYVFQVVETKKFDFYKKIIRANIFALNQALKAMAKMEERVKILLDIDRVRSSGEIVVLENAA